MAASIATAVHPAFPHFCAPARFTAAPAVKTGMRAKGMTNLRADCRKIDAVLAGCTWFLGDCLSAVDCYSFVFWGWGLRVGSPMAELRHFAAHAERMRARPSARRVLERESDRLP